MVTEIKIIDPENVCNNKIEVFPCTLPDVLVTLITGRTFHSSENSGLHYADFQWQMEQFRSQTLFPEIFIAFKFPEFSDGWLTFLKFNSSQIFLRRSQKFCTICPRFEIFGTLGWMGSPLNLSALNTRDQSDIEAEKSNISQSNGGMCKLDKLQLILKLLLISYYIPWRDFYRSVESNYYIVFQRNTLS